MQIVWQTPYIGAELHFADGTVVPLPDGRAVEIGRAVKDRRICAALARGATVSRRHAEVTLSGRHVTINDLDSSNGTFVDAAEAKPRVSCPLQPLVIGLGHSVEVRLVPIHGTDETVEA